MRTFVRLLATATLGLMIVGVLDTPEASARKQYQTQMGKQYPDLLKEKGDKKGDKTTMNCNTCHVKGKSKKKRNDYGVALEKALGKDKKTKDTAIIKKAFEKVEKEKSVKDKAKTYGELIKEKKLPGTEKAAN